MTTRAEIDREIKEIKARMRAKMGNRKKFETACREIMTSEETDERKAFLVAHEAESYMDDAFHRFPECREIEAHQSAVEEEHTGTPERPTYCPSCGTWSPAPPMKWVGLCRDWARAKKARIKKLAGGVLKRKAA